METVIWLGVGVIALFALAAWLAAWARTDTWGRSAAVMLLGLGIPSVVAAGVQSLGQHRPLALAWEMPKGDVRVLSVKMIQDKAIYLYVEAGREAPWPIVLPWSNETANKIQKAQNESPADAEGQFMMRYEPSLDTHGPQFHPLPQPPALPPKPVPAPAPQFKGSDA